jgi:hemerythrin
MAPRVPLTGGSTPEATEIELMARTWTPKLAIGVPAIDNQHKELFERSDALLDAMRLGKGADEVKKLLHYLEQYATLHFGAEERLMQKQRFPGFAQHKLLHDEFRKEFNAIKDSIEKAGTSSGTTLRLNSLMGVWLIQHIGNVDLKLGQAVGDQAQL